MTFPSAGRLWRRRWTVVVASSISMTHITGWLIISGALLVIFSLLVPSAPLQAQIRGVYPLGMSATNSGVTPDSGFTYSNSFLSYFRDELRGPNGEVLGIRCRSPTTRLHRMLRARSVVAEDWPTPITSRSFWAGAQNALKFAPSMGS